MTIVLTAGVSADTAVTPTQTLTTASVTPVANSLFFAAVSFYRNSHAGALSGSPITDSVGGAWTQVSLSAGTHTFGAGFAEYYGLYVCDLTADAAPAARTVTYDPYSTVDTGGIIIRTFSATGTGISIRAATTANVSTATTSASVTLTAAATPLASDTTVVTPGGNIDTPFAAMAAISGFTALINPVPGCYAGTAVFYMAGNTSAAVTETNLGSTPGGSSSSVVHHHAAGVGWRRPGRRSGRPDPDDVRARRHRRHGVPMAADHRGRPERHHLHPVTQRLHHTDRPPRQAGQQGARWFVDGDGRVQTKATAKAFGGSSTFTGALTLARVVLMSLTGSVTATGNLLRQTNKALAGSTTGSGALTKAASKPLSGSATATGTLRKLVAKVLAGSSTFTGALALSRVVLLAISGSITATGNLVRQTNKGLGGTVTASRSPRQA